MDDTMDNQQILTEAEKAWLCGFFDGEGNVGMNVASNYAAKKRSTNRQTIMIPRLVFSNTHYATIMYVKKILEKANIGTHIQCGRKGSEKHKPIYRATINGHKRCNKAIPVLLSYCITKKAPLQILQKWLEHRQNDYHYSLKDYEFYIEFMKVNVGKDPNDSTLRRLYDSCTSELNHSEGVKKAWESRRKVESGQTGNFLD